MKRSQYAHVKPNKLRVGDVFSRFDDRGRVGSMVLWVEPSKAGRVFDVWSIDERGIGVRGVWASADILVVAHGRRCAR